uniref:GRAM domain-containing protein n=1 Tax=Strongyloides stercoralis TaxID=6248 RepID=A0AAF5DIT5_STRER
MSKECNKDNGKTKDKRNNKGIKKYLLDITDSFYHDNMDSCKCKEKIVKKNLYSIKNEIRRCLTICEPLFEIILGWKEIILWKQPFQSLCFICCYFYLSYNGYLLQVILFLILTQILFNYLYYIKNIAFFNIKLFPPKKRIISPLHKKPSHQMLYVVLQKVSIYLSNLSNFLEKINSIFVCQNDNVTEIFFIIITLFLLLLFILPFEIVSRIFMICLGIRIFVGTFIITNFPKTAKKIDFVTYMLSEVSISSNNIIKNCKSENSKYIKKQQQKKDKYTLEFFNAKIKEESRKDLFNLNNQTKDNLGNINNNISYYHPSTSSNDDSDIDTILKDNNNNVIKKIYLFDISNNNRCKCNVLFLSKTFYGNVKIGTLFIEKK